MCRTLEENCAVLRYYAATNYNCSPTFRDNLSVPGVTPWRWDW